MTDSYSGRRLGSDDQRRADDIHVQQQKRRSIGPLIGLSLLALALAALWAHSRNRAQPAAAASCGQTTVQFERYRAELSPTSKASLSELATCLRAHPSQTVALEGRAEGSELTYDSSLPRERADVLAAQLGAFGVPDKQVAVEPNPTPCRETGGECQSASAIPRPEPQ